MTESHRPFRTYGLDARLARLERELSRLGAELAEVRALVARTEAEAPATLTTEPRPAPPPAAPARAEPRRPAAPAPPAAPPAPPAAPPAPAPTPPPPPAPPKPPRRTLGELARDWDLVGARGFAIAGGAVMALGIGLFFVLAANRGWIDERARVALGATASGLVFAAGLLLRARFGQYWSALAAVGAGIAGAYATLAAAAARYDLVPDALALPLAGVIAGVGTVVAVRWRSQVIAGIGLLGAALAPALQSLDTELTWESAAFAVIVLVAAAAVGVPRDWRALLVAVSLVVAAQVEWLAAEAPLPAEPGAVAVASALCLVLLAISVGRQLARGRVELDPLALGYATSAFALALALALQLFADDGDRGAALLSAAVVWALVFVALHVGRLPDLALVVGVSALALAAVGTAYLLVGATLTVVWAAQSVALTAVARRFEDARLRATAIAYAALATAHALVTDASLGKLFEETADRAGGILPLASAAAAAGAAGLLAPERYVPLTEEGLLAFVRDVRLALERRRSGLAEALCFAAAALATLAGSFALVAVSFEPGHVAASFLAAGSGAVTLGVAGLRRSLGLAIASYAWLGAVLVEAYTDVDRFYDDVSELSPGGWSVLGACAGLLAGAYAHRVVAPDRRGADVLLGIASGIVAASASIGAALVTETSRAYGIALLLVAVAYGALAAGVFTREGLRGTSTILWSFGLVFLVGAETALVTDGVWRTVVIVSTGLAVGVVAKPLEEMRLWLAGSSLVLVTTVVALLAQVQPWLAEGELERRVALASAACAVAAFGLVAPIWREARWRDLATILWSAGLLAALATERVLIDDLRRTAFVVALTGAALALLARPLRETRLWFAGAVVAGVTTFVTMQAFTPPSHFFQASESPAAGVWVLAACILALVALVATVPKSQSHVLLPAVPGGLALYAVSLAMLEIAVDLSGGSVETGFERGHTAVSALWALLGLTLLVVGLLRGSGVVRYAGLALFGLSLAKIFLYDLAELSSVARAFSFILVGALLLAGGFFLQRLSGRIGPPRPPAAPSTGD